MGDPVSTGILALNAAGTGAGIFSALAGGQQSKVNAQLEAGRARMQAERLKVAAEAAKVRGIQVDTAFREDLNQSLQNLYAIRAAQGASVDSPTSRALGERARVASDRARRVAVSNERLRAMGLENEAAAAEGDAMALLRASRRYRTASLISAAGQAISGAGSFLRAGQTAGYW